MVPLATGSDFGGLRTPASLWVVGFRPSPGVVPSELEPVSLSVSVNGPMGRTVADIIIGTNWV